jgi:hypothetical protein
MTRVLGGTGARLYGCFGEHPGWSQALAALVVDKPQERNSILVEEDKWETAYD